MCGCGLLRTDHMERRRLNASQTFSDRPLIVIWISFEKDTILSVTVVDVYTVSYRQMNLYESPFNIISQNESRDVSVKSVGFGFQCNMEVQGGRRRGRQRKRWEDNIREWTGLEWNTILWKAEKCEEWRKLVVKSTVVPQRSARLRDR